MFGLDEWIAGLAGGDSATVAVVLGVALLLGLRHATDPDHLAAVSALVAGDRLGAARLGLLWGLGHGTTLLAFGLPIVLSRSYLPDRAQRAAELLVGLVIVALALRLLARRRRFAVRSGWSAYGVGFVHGVGGSAGVGILLLAGIPEQGAAVAALVLFAAAAACSMAAASAAFGRALALPRAAALTPMLGVGSLAFGAWYAVAAVT